MSEQEILDVCSHEIFSCLTDIRARMDDLKREGKDLSKSEDRFITLVNAYCSFKGALDRDLDNAGH